jgi:mitogen-activated protein kinase 1/3
MHSANVIHRDIKPGNFLIDGNCGVKICDFGLSRTLPKKSKELKEFKEHRKALKKKVSYNDPEQKRLSQEEIFKKEVSEKYGKIAEKLNNEKRVLSNCIVSRWYRPPEIVLTQKNYDQAVDIWSMGCIFAEMLYCTDEYNHDFQSIINNRYLFPGSSCFPISPCDEMKKQKGDKDDESLNIVS